MKITSLTFGFLVVLQMAKASQGRLHRSVKTRLLRGGEGVNLFTGVQPKFQSSVKQAHRKKSSINDLAPAESPEPGASHSRRAPISSGAGDEQWSLL